MQNRVVLTWNDPTTRVDDTPLPSSDIRGVQLFRSEPPGPVGDPNPPGAVMMAEVAAGVQTYTSDVLAEGSYNFRAVVVDQDGVESGIWDGNIVRLDVVGAPSAPKAAPKGATNLAGHVI